ncbi:MAG: amidophosphoribosyltransferase [Aquificaceae bacterium]
MCGIFGIFNAEYAERYAFYGIYALQHRGQESVGIAVSDFEDIRAVKKPGLVLEGIRKEELESLSGYNAIAHVRYSTAGDSGGLNSQPLLRDTPLGRVAVAHNGNLVNYIPLRVELEGRGIRFMHTSDTELFLALLEEGENLPEGVDLHPSDVEVLPRVFHALSRVRGAYSLLLLFKDRLIAVRDPMGFRPLLMGRLKNSVLFASESCAFDILQAELWREVKPGEVVVVDTQGIRSYFPFKSEKKAMCIFELVYFSKPESFVFDSWVYRARKRMGELLAYEDEVFADIVVPVPDSGLVPAMGYAQAKGLPLELGLIRNHYVGRSFMNLAGTERCKGSHEIKPKQGGA